MQARTPSLWPAAATAWFTLSPAQRQAEPVPYGRRGTRACEARERRARRTLVARRAQAALGFFCSLFWLLCFSSRFPNARAIEAEWPRRALSWGAGSGRSPRARSRLKGGTCQIKFRNLRKKNDQRFAIVEQVAGPVIAPAPPQVKVTIKAYPYAGGRLPCRGHFVIQ